MLLYKLRVAVRWLIKQYDEIRSCSLKQLLSSWENRSGPLEESRVKIFKFLRDVSKEMQKVVWPKGNELVTYTITVIATVAFVAIFFTIVDVIITQVLNLL